MPGLTAATAWAIQHSTCAEALEANYHLPGPPSRKGISALQHTYRRTLSPDGRVKPRIHSRTPQGIVSRASGVDSVYVCAVRIHPRYRGTPPKSSTARSFLQTSKLSSPQTAQGSVKMTIMTVCPTIRMSVLRHLPVRWRIQVAVPSTSCAPVTARGRTMVRTSRVSLTDQTILWQPA